MIQALENANEIKSYSKYGVVKTDWLQVWTWVAIGLLAIIFGAIVMKQIINLPYQFK